MRTCGIQRSVFSGVCLFESAWFVESLTERRAQLCRWKGCSVGSWCLLVSASWVLGSQVRVSTSGFIVSVGNVISISQTCVAHILSTVPSSQHQNFQRQRMKKISPMFSHTAADNGERNPDLLWTPHPLCIMKLDDLLHQLYCECWANHLNVFLGQLIWVTLYKKCTDWFFKCFGILHVFKPKCQVWTWGH